MLFVGLERDGEAVAFNRAGKRVDGERLYVGHTQLPEVQTPSLPIRATRGKQRPGLPFFPCGFYSSSYFLLLRAGGKQKVFNVPQDVLKIGKGSFCFRQRI